MVATVSAHHLAYLSHLQGKCRIFEGLLHVSPIKVPQVSTPLAARALRILNCDILEGFWVGPHLFQELLDIGLGFLAGPGYFFLSIGVKGPPGLLVLL